MRFHNKNNAVHLLVEGTHCQVEIDQVSTELPMALHFIKFEFEQMKPAFRKSIQFICKPFLEAYMKAKERLTEVLQKEPIKKSGALIYSFGRDYTLTTFYDVETRFNGKEMIGNGRIAIFINFENHALPELIFYTQMKDNGARTYLPMNLARDDFQAQPSINDVLCLLLFMKHCPVETKLIARGKKISHSHEDYLNKTDFPIEIVDSTWFTTVVRSEGFAVSGHFRLQPVGPGGADRRLIWIAPYEKKGYLRLAKVLRSRDKSDDGQGDDSSSAIFG